jgi:hypothetical protein
MGCRYSGLLVLPHAIHVTLGLEYPYPLGLESKINPRNTFSLSLYVFVCIVIDGQICTRTHACLDVGGDLFCPLDIVARSCSRNRRTNGCTASKLVPSRDTQLLEDTLPVGNSSTGSVRRKSSGNGLRQLQLCVRERERERVSARAMWNCMRQQS